MTIIDSHCHPFFPQYDADREEMIARATEAGVSMICVGTNYEDSKKAIELAESHNNIWATVGLHPNDIDSSVVNQELWSELIVHPRVVAVGEVGLDYYRLPAGEAGTPEPEKQAEQKKVLKFFLDLAVEHDKPVILHARDASKGSTGRVHADILQILGSCNLEHKTKSSMLQVSSSTIRGVIHSCTASVEEAAQFVSLEFYLGFNGIITFPPSRKASDGQVPGMYDEMIRSIPLDRILLETDAPFLAPELYRGKRNEPVYILEVAKRVAELKGLSLEDVMSQTTANAQKLFGL